MPALVLNQVISFRKNSEGLVIKKSKMSLFSNKIKNKSLDALKQSGITAKYMSLKLAMLLAALAAFVGVGFGYFLRWIISLGQRGSVELRIKQMELHAREEAKKITEEAQNKAEETLKE